MKLDFEQPPLSDRLRAGTTRVPQRRKDREIACKPENDRELLSAHFAKIDPKGTVNEGSIDGMRDGRGPC